MRHLQKEFFGEIFFKPQVLIEIRRLRMFLMISDHLRYPIPPFLSMKKHPNSGKKKTSILEGGSLSIAPPNWYSILDRVYLFSELFQEDACSIAPEALRMLGMCFLESININLDAQKNVDGKYMFFLENQRIQIFLTPRSAYIILKPPNRAKGAFSVGVEIGRSSRKECPRAVYVRVPQFF